MLKAGLLTLAAFLVIMVAFFSLVWFMQSTPHCIEYPDGKSFCRVHETPFKQKYYWED